MANFYAIYPAESASASGIQSINGDTTSAQIIAGGVGISVATVAGTTTITNTGDITAGNLTDVGTDGIVITGGTGAVVGSGTSIAQHVADASHNGYLSSSDWSTFNAKQATVSVGAFGSTPNANGLDLTAAVLTMEPADASNPGGVSTTTQTFAGNKTFGRGAAVVGTSDEVQLSIQGNSSQSNRLVQYLSSGFSDLGSIDNSGNLRAAGNISATSGGSISGGSYFGSSANSATTGLYNLTHADTIAFRNQINNADLTLGVNSSDVFTFSSSIGATNFSGSSSGSNTGDQTISLTGDVTASGGTGSLTTAYAGTVPLNKGGTGQTTKAPAFDALSPMSASGDIIYGGTAGTGTALAKGSDGKVLTLVAGLPSWQPATSASVATPTATGTVTSYWPTIQSGLKSVTSGDYSSNIFTMNTTDGFETYLFTTGNTNRTFALAAAANNAGRRAIIKKVDTGTGSLTIDGNSAETIDGYSTVLIYYQFDSLEIYCDGAAWYVTQVYSLPTAWTPTGTFNNSTYTGFLTRTGLITVEFRVFVAVTNTVSAATFTVTLPNSWTAATTKMTNATNSNNNLGPGGVNRSAWYICTSRYVTSSTIGLKVYDDAANGVTGANVTQAVPDNFINGDELDMIFTLPISQLAV